MVRILLFELSENIDTVRDDGSDMRWLEGRKNEQTMGYLDYLKIINQATENVIAFLHIDKYPVWYQLAVHAHEARHEVWVFGTHKVPYAWAKVFHPMTLIDGLCWKEPSALTGCYLRYTLVNSDGKKIIVNKRNRYCNFGCIDCKF